MLTKRLDLLRGYRSGGRVKSTLSDRKPSLQKSGPTKRTRHRVQLSRPQTVRKHNFPKCLLGLTGFGYALDLKAT